MFIWRAPQFAIPYPCSSPLCALRLTSTVLHQLGSPDLWLLIGLGHCEALTGSQRVGGERPGNVSHPYPTSLPSHSFLYQQGSISQVAPLPKP